jgi:hypothetical protein
MIVINRNNKIIVSKYFLKHAQKIDYFEKIRIKLQSFAAKKRGFLQLMRLKMAKEV